MSARVCVVTATRAEYGLLRPLLHRLQAADWCDLAIIATGAHLLPEFGDTWRAIVADGFTIERKVAVDISGDSEAAIAVSAGATLSAFAEAFAQMRPDVVVVLGDRYEMLSVATAAFLQRIPVAHLYGGDVTTGALDDGLRHAITKLSRIHFTATEESRRRVMQLGEDPAWVFAVGALGVDVALSEATMSEAETRDLLGLPGERPYVVVTYHPETVLADSGEAGLRDMLQALAERGDIDVVLTASNADASGREFTRLMREWAETHASRARFVASLGSPGFVCAVKWAAAVVGNSSGAIVEAPSLGTPSLNIGERQAGRERAASAVDVTPDIDAIRDGLARVLAMSAAGPVLADNPWGDGHAAERITELLGSRMEALLGTPKPPFHDIDTTAGASGDGQGARR